MRHLFPPTCAFIPRIRLCVTVSLQPHPRSVRTNYKILPRRQIPLHQHDRVAPSNFFITLYVNFNRKVPFSFLGVIVDILLLWGVDLLALVSTFPNDAISNFVERHPLTLLFRHRQTMLITRAWDCRMLRAILAFSLGVTVGYSTNQNCK